MKNIFTKMMYETDKKHDVMLVTVIRHFVHSPREAGKQMLVDKYGKVHGTIGGGCIEDKVRKKAEELLKEKRSDICEFITMPKEGEDSGMVCSSHITVFFQYIAAGDEKWHIVAGEVLSRINDHMPGVLLLHLDGSAAEVLDGADCEKHDERDYFAVKLPIGERAVIFGCGHCCKALVPVLASVGFRVTVYDDRKELMLDENYPAAERLICDSYENMDEHIALSPDDYIVVMTSGHKFDYFCEKKAFDAGFSYLGVMGSKKKKVSIDARLLKEGIPQEQIDRAHLPVGLKIKSKTPEEIAVSIAAEMIYERALNREKAASV